MSVYAERDLIFKQKRLQIIVRMRTDACQKIFEPMNDSLWRFCPPANGVDYTNLDFPDRYLQALFNYFTTN
jgi:hypothetical protein